MLKHSQARSIAEALWGRGGTNSYPTNRSGAFYFCCTGHGGFVIDARCLTPEEREAIAPYVSFEKATTYTWRRHCFIFHRYQGRRTARVSMDARVEEFEFFLLEEDCDWCLAYLFTGITAEGSPAAEAQATFDRWIKK